MQHLVCAIFIFQTRSSSALTRPFLLFILIYVRLLCHVLLFDALIIPSMKISHNGTTPSENEASLNFLLSVSYFASIITDRLISVAKSEQ